MVDADTQDVAEPGSGDEAMSAAGRGRPGGSVGWTSAVITVAVAGLLLFNAQSMRAWTETQAPGSLTLAARSFAESWWETTSQLDLTVPRSAVADLWAAAQAARWPAGAGAPAANPACAAGARVGSPSGGDTGIALSGRPKRPCEATPGQR